MAEQKELRIAQVDHVSKAGADEIAGLDWDNSDESRIKMKMVSCENPEQIT